MYNEFPRYLNSIFNYKPSIHVRDISDIDINSLLTETFSPLQITTDQHSKDNQVITVSRQRDRFLSLFLFFIIQYNVIPRGSMSLKVLAESPMNTILMFQMNKNLLSQDIPEVILLIANLIVLQPTEEQRSNPNNKEINADFVAAQVKALSFLAYFMKSHKVIITLCLTKRRI